MKLTIHQDLSIPEPEIIIKCVHMDARLKHLINLIRQHGFSLTGYQEEQEFQLPLEQIYFIDSADGKTFLYLEKEVYSCRETLTSLEEKLSLFVFGSFFRNGFSASFLISFTLIFLITDIGVFWYFHKRQEIQAMEINDLIRREQD